MPVLTQAKEIKSEVWIAVTFAAPELCIPSPGIGQFSFTYCTNTQQEEQPMCQNICVLGSRSKGSKMRTRDIRVGQGSHATLLMAHRQQTITKPAVHTAVKEETEGLHSSCCLPRVRHRDLNQDCARSLC